MEETATRPKGRSLEFHQDKAVGVSDAKEYLPSVGVVVWGRRSWWVEITSASSGRN
jgi:hypothetical protein